MGYSYFPEEIMPTPRSWVATTGNLVFFKAHKNVRIFLNISIVWKDNGAWTGRPLRSDGEDRGALGRRRGVR